MKHNLITVKQKHLGHCTDLIANNRTIGIISFSHQIQCYFFFITRRCFGETWSKINHVSLISCYLSFYFIEKSALHNASEENEIPSKKRIRLYRHWMGCIPYHSAWPLLTSLWLLYWRGLERNGIWFLSRMFRDSIILYTACLIHYIWIEIYNYLKIASGHRKWITANPWKMCAILVWIVT